LGFNDQGQTNLVDKTTLQKTSDTTILKYDQPLYNEVIRDYNPLFHEELANQLPNQRSKISSCRFHAILVGMVAYANI
jgi:hypothetical protein